jgi:quinolinate synthase
MVRHVRDSRAPIHLVATEVGMLHRLKKEAPHKQYIPVKADAICEYMKTITLPKLYRCAARHGVRSARGGADSQPRPPSD